MADRRAAEAAAANAGEPEVAWTTPPRRIGRKLFLGCALLVILWQIGAARRPPPPQLAADCTTPAFKLSTDTVKQARPVLYTIVGPADRRFVLGVDTQTFVHGADGWTAVPLPGHDDSYEVAAGVKAMPKCRRTGLFALPVPLGPHVVILYELADTTAREIARTTITVTAD